MNCGELFFFHRNHRISYKNSPHSPHFLQKFNQKPRPGKETKDYGLKIAFSLGIITNMNMTKLIANKHWRSILERHYQPLQK